MVSAKFFKFCILLHTFEFLEIQYKSIIFIQ